MKSTTGSSDVSLFVVACGETNWSQGEPHIISAFLELVVKLNETAFRPLFRRLYDWAFAAENGESLPNRTVFLSLSYFQQTLTARSRFATCTLPCWIISRCARNTSSKYPVINPAQGLMNPYMSMLLQALCDILESLAAGSIQNPLLWLSTVETLTKSFENDDAGENT
jgi:U3 small nucleolar RNA-associated protein 10